MLEYFSPEFDGAFYRLRYGDLHKHSDVELKQHFDLHGRSEGRLASPMALRSNFVATFMNANKALEIGPFNKPMLAGANSNFFDVLDQDGLRKRAISINESPDRVPTINYVSPKGDINVIIDKFDLIVSSHCVEHQPDLVRHLQGVERLLEPAGVYALLVPDCRYCFDYSLAPSHIGQVLEAFHEERKVHRLASVVEHRALTTHNDPQRHWHGDHGEVTFNIRRIKDAIIEWQNSGGTYIDVHAWQFNPDSFATIFNGLYDLNLTKLRVHRVYHTPFGSNEFCAVLATS